MTGEAPTTPRVGVVIVNYHQPALTRAAIASALASRDVETRVFVIDNECSAEQTQTEFDVGEHVEAWANAENVGFGAACNQGIDAALAWGAQGVLLLNNDARLEPEAAKLLLESAQQAGMAAPLITFPDGRVYSAGGVAQLGRARCYNRGFGEALRDEWLRPARCGFASACALMLARDALIGGQRFYAPYFLYFEDADLCLRLGWAGFSVAYQPAARVTHEGSATTGGPGARIPAYYGTRNRALLIRRNAGGMQRAAAWVYWLTAALREIVTDFAAGRGARGRAVAEGLRDGLLGRFGRWINSGDRKPEH